MATSSRATLKGGVTQLFRSALAVHRLDRAPALVLHGDQGEAVLVILEGGLREWDFWSTKATLGLVARSGNTDQSDLNAVINIRRQSPRTRLNLKYNGNFGTVSDEQTINNHNATADVNALVSAGFFVIPAAFNAAASAEPEYTRAWLSNGWPPSLEAASFVPTTLNQSSSPTVEIAVVGESGS